MLQDSAYDDWYNQTQQPAVPYPGVDVSTHTTPGPWESGYVPYYPPGTPMPDGNLLPTQAPTAVDYGPSDVPPPTTTDTGGGGGGTGGGGFTGLGGGTAAPSFNWPTFAAPGYQAAGAFKPRNPTFSFADFQAPTLAQAQQEPGYQFSLDQGRKALENSAAARGTLRSGGTLKDILQYGNQFAEQNYGNVFNRAQSVWGGNRQNALDKFGLEYGVDKDTYDRAAADIGNQNQYNYRSAWDTFSSKDSQRKFELSDALDRWKSQLGALTSLAQPVI